MANTDLVLELHEAGTTNTEIDGSVGGSVYSEAIEICRIGGTVAPHFHSAPTDIAINAHVITPALTGAMQGVIAFADSDWATASTKWGDITGTDLSGIATGGCLSFSGVYTHVRARVATGKTHIDIASSSPIREVT